jgi:uncharacterized protein YndB with AHSA1/START domain
VREEEKEKP